MVSPIEVLEERLRVDGVDELVVCTSSRYAAWICAEDHKDQACRGDGRHGQHGEDWRYSTRILTPVGVSVCELVIYTGQMKRMAVPLDDAPAGLYIHRSYPLARTECVGEECHVLGAPCFGSDNQRSYSWLAEFWAQFAPAFSPALRTFGPRSRAFWEALIGEHRALTRGDVDARTVWAKCTHCDGEGWVQK